MKKFLKRSLLFLPLIALIALTNLVVDPANIFKNKEFEQSIANYLLGGYNVTNASDYDERIFQKCYIESLRRRPEVIVLGSSRSVQISSALFPGKSFFNNSVSSGSIEDYMAIFRMYEKRGLVPDTVLLCVDPWILNANLYQSGFNNWEPIGSYYKDMMSELSNVHGPLVDLAGMGLQIEKAAQLFSPTYFQSSIALLIKSASDKGSFHLTPTKDIPYESNVKLIDGSLVYGRTTKEVTEDETLGAAKSYVTRGVELLYSNYTRDDRVELFLGYLASRKVKVILFIPPYHPYVYDYLAKEHRLVMDIEADFRGIARKYGFRVIGSYDPAVCGLSGKDFYDHHHLKRESITAFLERSLPADY